MHALRNPTNGAEPLSFQQLGKRFGISSKCVGELLRRHASELRAQSEGQ